MAEKSDDSGWAEIDTSRRGPSTNVEKVEYDETPDVDASSDDDSAGTEYVEEAAPEVEQPTELEGIETKGAEKRIRQLVQQRRERDVEIEAMKNEMAQMRSTLINTQKTTKTFEISSITSKEEGLKEKIKLAESQYLSAYDNGEKEKLLEAQNIMNDAKTDLKILQLRKNQVEANNRTTPQEGGYTKVAEPQQREATRSPAPSKGADPVAQEWLEKNSWFTKDEVATMVALGFDQKLKNEGFDPSTKEFYNEIDKLMRKELPHKFKARAADNTNKPSQVVAGSSRSSSPNSGKNKVKLTERDVTLAKKWGIPLDRYAQEKKRAESTNDSYTAINVNRV